MSGRVEYLGRVYDAADRHLEGETFAGSARDIARSAFLAGAGWSAAEHEAARPEPVGDGVADDTAALAPRRPVPLPIEEARARLDELLPRVEPADRRREIARIATAAHRDLDEAMHHALLGEPLTEAGVAVLRGRLLDAAGHAISAAHEALRL